MVDDTLLYDTYINAGRSPTLILPSTLLTLFSCAGIVLNSFLIYTTVQSPSLHGTCNWLLAVAAACDAIHQSSNFVTFFVTSVTGWNLIKRQLCYFLMLVPMTGFTTMILVIALIALDRLLTVLYPTKSFRDRWKALYLVSILLPCIAFPLALEAYDYGEILQSKNYTYTPCAVGDCYGPTSGLVLCVVIVASSLTACGSYLTIWLIMRRGNSPNMNEEGYQRTKRLFKSLLTVMLVVVGCYTTTGVVMIAVELSGLDTLRSWFVLQGVACLVSVTVAMTAPILYITSSEYRTQFQRVIDKMTLRMLGQAIFLQQQQKVHVVTVTKTAVREAGGGNSIAPGGKLFQRGARISSKKRKTQPDYEEIDQSIFLNRF